MTTMGTGKGPSKRLQRGRFHPGILGAQAKASPKAPKVMPLSQLRIFLSSPSHLRKAKTLPPKGERKAKTRARTRVADKGKGKGKGKDQKG